MQSPPVWPSHANALGKTNLPSAERPQNNLKVVEDWESNTVEE